MDASELVLTCLRVLAGLLVLLACAAVLIGRKR
jgi:hypothetical protein